MSENSTTVNPKPNRRRLSFSLRALLLLTILAGLGFGFWHQSVKKMRDERSAVMRLDRVCHLEFKQAHWPRSSLGWLSPDGNTERVLGLKVSMSANKGSFESEHLELLPKFPHLQKVEFLSRFQKWIYDAPNLIKILSACPSLKSIRIEGSPINKDQIERLAELSYVEEIYIDGADVDWHAAIPFLKRGSDFKFDLALWQYATLSLDNDELDTLIELVRRKFLQPPTRLNVSHSDESTIVRCVTEFPDLKIIQIDNVSSLNQEATELATSNVDIRLIGDKPYDESTWQKISELFQGKSLTINGAYSGPEASDEFKASLTCSNEKHIELFVREISQESAVKHSGQKLLADVRDCEFRNCKPEVVNQVVRNLSSPSRINIRDEYLTDVSLLGLENVSGDRVSFTISDAPLLKSFRFPIIPRVNRMVFTIRNCPNLARVDGFEDATNIRGIRLADLNSFGSFSNLGKVTTLVEVAIARCSRLTNVTWLPPSVRELRLYDCQNLVSLDGIENLEGLHVLTLDGEFSDRFSWEEAKQLIAKIAHQLSSFDGPPELEELVAKAREAHKKGKREK